MKMLVAVDFSPVGREVAHEGYRLAKKLGMTPCFFHCAPMTSRFLEGYDIKAFVSAASRLEVDRLMEVAEQQLKKVAEDVQAEDTSGDKIEVNHCVTYGDAGEEIVNYAKDYNFDMIIIGYKSYSTIERLLVGSTASKVARYAPCSVLIYRPKD
jgi:nucleotide-binding universal stress UspA family protein